MTVDPTWITRGTDEREEIVSAVDTPSRRQTPTGGEGDSGQWTDVEVTPALKALAHPARWTMMELIHRGGGEICVCEFQDHLDLSQPTISHHLKTLREAGLIESRQEGTWVYHTLRRESARALAARLERWARPADA